MKDLTGPFTIKINRTLLASESHACIIRVMATHSIIDLKEKFPNLGDDAPIVEATIGIHAPINVEWDETTLTGQLTDQLGGYPTCLPIRSFVGELSFGPGKTPQQNIQDVGWEGLRFESENKKYVIQCRKEQFVFSQLQPYENWNLFLGEALRTWEIHKEVFKIQEIQRLGLRFINRIAAPEGSFELGTIFTNPPSSPDALPLTFSSFLHQETFNVEGLPYAINVVKTVQPEPSVSLIYDIDVFTMTVPSISNAELTTKLNEMRFIKNKLFFNGLQPEVWKAWEK